MTVLICLCACPDDASARRIAEALVSERLAACVNLIPGLTSFYRWQGAVEQASEILLLIKTTDERLPALTSRLTELHPYELPEVLAVQADAGLPAYLQWVTAQTTDEDA